MPRPDLSRALGGLMWSLLVLARFLHSQFIQPVGDWASDVLLPVWEESFKAVLRELLTLVTRSVNTSSGVLLSALSGRTWWSYARRRRVSLQRHTEAWSGWFASASSTFNALLEREGLAEGEEPQQQHQQPPTPPSAAALAAQQQQQQQQPTQRRGRWRLRGWGRRSSATNGGAAAPADGSGAGGRGTASPTRGDLTRGSLLFELPSGFAISEAQQKRGLIEDLRLGAELGVGRAFTAVRRAIRAVLRLDGSSPDGGTAGERLARRGARDGVLRGAEEDGSAGAGGMPRHPAVARGLLQQGSGRKWEQGLSVWTASDAILRAGYPLEEHQVTTSDGYVLQLHRIPRHDARDVVLFQHGVLDTSLGWVANGSIGSSAFAAWDEGFDVWLANNRSNPPRLHVDKAMQGSRYWTYSSNELALCDIAAQINHVHRTKLAELQGPPRTGAAAPPAPNPRNLQRAATDSALSTLRRVDVRGGLQELEAQQRQQRKEQQWEQQRQGQAGASGAAAEESSSSGAAEEEGEQQAAPGLEVRVEQPGGMRRSQSEPAGAWATASSSGASFIRQRSGRDEGASLRQSSGAGASTSTGQEVLPYRLQAVGHSLGAACLLIYATVCRMRGQPHRLRRLVLMSPAGFHQHVPTALLAFKWLFPALIWLVDRIPGLRGHGVGLRLPSPLLRYVTFKLSVDMKQMPALDDLVKAWMKLMLSGDKSQWDQALAMPHYNTYSMPALSLHTGAQFGQWSRDPAFRLFDYGTAAANRRHYGTDLPPSIAEHYPLLDIPVDLLGGESDGVIAAENVQQHYRRLREAGVEATYRSIAAGHLDFTFAVKDDIRGFVLSRLLQPL